MEKRKRADSDDSSDSDETPAKRFKNSPTICTTKEDAVALLYSKKVFVFDPTLSSFSLPIDCCTKDHVKRLNRALQEEGNHLKEFKVLGDLSSLLTPERLASILQSFSNNDTLEALTIKNVSLKLADLSSILLSIKIEKEVKLETISQGMVKIEYKEVMKEAEKFINQCKHCVNLWTVDEVILLLQNLQLHAHEKKFRENVIKGDVLINLTTADLEQLGLDPRETKSLMSALLKLKLFKSLTEIPNALQWSTKQVGEWLAANNLGHLTNKFMQCNITGKELLVLGNHDMTYWLCITSIADKTALELALRKLCAELGAVKTPVQVEKLPKQFLCPITHEIMKDPVFTVDGHTYERSAIEKWLIDHDTSPLTNETLASKVLIPNHQLKSLISDFNLANVPTQSLEQPTKSVAVVVPKQRQTEPEVEEDKTTNYVEKHEGDNNNEEGEEENDEEIEDDNNDSEDEEDQSDEDEPEVKVESNIDQSNDDFDEDDEEEEEDDY